MDKQNNLSVLTKGIIKENPVLRLVLGTCPTLAITTAAINGIGMGVAATLVLIGSNVAISLLRNVIPDKVRIPAFITIIAAFVTIIQMLVKAFLPTIDSALGIYLPLIVVNCIILARAEMFASKNRVIPSILDAIGMGIGFTAALTLMGIIREVIGAGTVFGLPITQGYIDPMLVFILPPGGFFVFGILVALSNKLAVSMGKKPVKSLGCHGCDGCNGCAAYENAVDSENGAVVSDAAVVTNEKVAKQFDEELPESYADTVVSGETTTDAFMRTEAEGAEKAETKVSDENIQSVQDSVNSENNLNTVESEENNDD